MAHMTTFQRTVLARLLARDLSDATPMKIDGRSLPALRDRGLIEYCRVAQYPRTSGGWGMERGQIRDVIRLTYINSFGTVAHEEQSIQEVLS